MVSEEGGNDMNTISRQDLDRMLQRKDNFLLIDVLSTDSFQEKHIPGSVSVPISDPDFVRKVENQAANKTGKIVCYCGSLQCDASMRAAHQLEESGFTNVYRYEGGLADWEKAGLPLEGTLVSVN